MFFLLTAVPLVAIALAAGFLCLRNSRYRCYFCYDRALDYKYEFDRQACATHAIEVFSEDFTWPERTGDWDTALLELRVEASFLGGNFDPSIAVSLEGRCLKSSFERGAKGIRYLDVSQLREMNPIPGTRVNVRGQHISWGRKGRLILFDNRLPVRPRTLVIAPHPDDAEIASFGFYRAAASFIVTILAGEKGGGFLQNHRKDSDLIGKLRVWDSIMVPSIGNVPPDRAINLGYPDGDLEGIFSNPTRELQAGSVDAYRGCNISGLLPASSAINRKLPWRALVLDLVTIIQHVKPEVIVLPHPLLDDHPDHAFSVVAVCEAIKECGLTEGHLLLHTVHAPGSSLFPFGENDSLATLPPHFGEPLPFRGVYSFPLDADARQLKLVALEAMHDLRTLPTLRAPSWSEIFRSFAAEIYWKLNGMSRHPTSYFRRAVRPNELFFVMPLSESESLSQEFLSRWRARKLRWNTFQ